MKPLSLHQLNNLVKQSLRECLPDEYWVQAELSDVRTHSSGHCYLEFIQKDPKNNTLQAKARGTIWSNVFRLIKPYFEQETGQTFTSGLNVLVKVVVEFHELYGYSLTVIDIDPTYTLGDMAKRRQEIIKQLDAEGVLTLNKELELSVLPKRIAVISSPTAAGYGDFCDQLTNNTYEFVFHTRLFPAIMQGERVEESIIDALNTIYLERDQWDVVVIIRGGGATSDLSGFDTYLLAANCAQFPLPIITGIGHERDDTVLDMVSHTRVKTPTAAAEFLINHLRLTATQLEEYASSIVSSVTSRMTIEKSRLQFLAEKLPGLFQVRKLKEEYRFDFIQQRVTNSIRQRFIKENHSLALLEQQLRSVSPETILKRGYSMTLKDGKIIKNAAKLKKGDKLITRFWKGEVTSEVE